MSEGYMNLADVAGVDTVRDTSTCEYHPSARDIVLMPGCVQITTDQRKDEGIMDIRSTGDCQCNRREMSATFIRQTCGRPDHSPLSFLVIETSSILSIYIPTIYKIVISLFYRKCIQDSTK